MLRKYTVVMEAEIWDVVDVDDIDGEEENEAESIVDRPTQVHEAELAGVTDAGDLVFHKDGALIAGVAAGRWLSFVSELVE